MSETDWRMETNMRQGKIMCECDVCGNSYQNGPEIYEGHKLKLYGSIFCCDIWWEGNWDGWGPVHEEALLRHLSEKGLPVPKRNEKGYLPRN